VLVCRGDTVTTVACVFVRGEYPYTPEYVVRLQAMVTRWIDRPYRFVCLTDHPGGLPVDLETIAVAKLSGFAPWTKLELFNPIRQWDGRVLYLDLDTLIVAPLAPILDVPAPFAITADPARGHSLKVEDSFGRRIVRRFNSSVMVWDGGTHTELYTKWTPAVAQRLSGDQDFIGEQLPHVYAMPREWFPRISELGTEPAREPAKIVLVKSPKNHIVAKELPWVCEAWA
jgi:hypothetical protein